ncbi:MAG: PLDc N-terminal domain-containing protein, partial [Chloroflexota bacterium]|nr:PLDc N-terminal domain-containing protein [Chloroflexota bacterium]
MIAIAIIGSIFWIWMLVECITREPSEGNDKVVWLLIILFTHMVGA